MFEPIPSLANKLRNSDNEPYSPTSSISSISSNQPSSPQPGGRSVGMSDSSTRGPGTPSIRGISSSEVANRGRDMEPRAEQRIVPSEKKKRIKLLEAVVGNEKNKMPSNDLKKRVLNNKLDVAVYFLDMLMQPNNFMNAEALKWNFKAEQIIALCNVAEDIIVNQPMILQAKPPLKIFGDIHGQFTDLMSFFALYGTPHEFGKKKDIENFDYIFLGDFVDRGSHSLETICLLLALKCLYPEQIHLIRGNHEDSQINVNFGFRDECAEKI